MTIFLVDFVGKCLENSGPIGEVLKKGSTEAYVAKLLGDSFTPEDIFEIAQEYDEKGEVPPLGLQRAFSNCLFEKLVDGNLIMAGGTMPGFARSVHWTPTRTFDDAFRLGKEILGNNPEIAVVPRVRSTIANIKEGCKVTNQPREIISIANIH